MKFKPLQGTAIALAGLLLAGGVSAQSTPAAKPATVAKASAPSKKARVPLLIEQRAIDMIKATSAKLAASGSMSFTAIVDVEYPSKLGPPLAFPVRYEVAMQRPDKLRVLQSGAGAPNEFYYDGKIMMAFLPEANLVAIADAPPTVEAALAQARAAQHSLAQERERLLPLLPVGGQWGGVGAGVGVQQGAHGGGPGQALPGMLAVDVDQVVGQLAQLAHGGRRAIDPGAAFAGGVDGAAQQHGVAFAFEAVVLQPGQGGAGGGEFGADLAALLAFAHPDRLAARAQHELQRVDQDGFAGAGFPRQRGEAGGQVQLQRGHDDEVAQAQVAQRHGSQTPPSFQCSFSRRVKK